MGLDGVALLKQILLWARTVWSASQFAPKDFQRYGLFNWVNSSGKSGQAWHLIFGRTSCWLDIELNLSSHLWSQSISFNFCLSACVLSPWERRGAWGQGMDQRFPWVRWCTDPSRRCSVGVTTLLPAFQLNSSVFTSHWLLCFFCFGFFSLEKCLHFVHILKHPFPWAMLQLL